MLLFNSLAGSVIKDVSIEPISPFSRDVCIRFNILGDLPVNADEYQVYLSASNLVSKEVFNAMNLRGSRNVVPGRHCVLWNVEENSLFGNGTYIFQLRLEKTYLVIDLSQGPSAKSYVISYLNDIPNGGWSDEYKTNKLVALLHYS